MKFFFVTKILPFVIGSFALIICSGFQKIIIGANPFKIIGYIVPVIYGGFAGLLIGYFKLKWEKESARVEKEKFQSVIEIAGAICHEMNQPMQAISGYSELLLIDISEDDPQYTYIKTIKGQIDKMGKITKKLMTLTKYETKDYLKGKIIDIDKASKKAE
jgi:hypothetical protein